MLHNVSRNLIRIWVDKFQAGALDDDIASADLLETCEARIVALERLVGKQALELEFLKGALQPRPRPRSEIISAIVSPAASTLPMAGICDEFEHYGWRRVQAALRQQGVVVNHKKVRRVMREHDLQPRMRRRFTTTTDSDYDQPILPNLAKKIVLDGPDQLWVADIIYVPLLAASFILLSFWMPVPGASWAMPSAVPSTRG